MLKSFLFSSILLPQPPALYTILHQISAPNKEVGNSDGMLSGIEQLHGKELSFNNINDLHGDRKSVV